MDRLTDGGGGCMFPITLLMPVAPLGGQLVAQFARPGGLPWRALLAAPVLALPVAAWFAHRSARHNPATLDRNRLLFRGFREESRCLPDGRDWHAAADPAAGS
uniref:hypothetical protein n=1 Tax=Amycolatopsis sp. CA-096443 TaxID=3239919 RepID=UPI003F496C98